MMLPTANKSPLHSQGVSLTETFDCHFVTGRHLPINSAVPLRSTVDRDIGRTSNYRRELFGHIVEENSLIRPAIVTTPDDHDASNES